MVVPGRPRRVAAAAVAGHHADLAVGREVQADLVGLLVGVPLRRGVPERIREVARRKLVPEIGLGADDVGAVVPRLAGPLAGEHVERHVHAHEQVAAEPGEVLVLERQLRLLAAPQQGAGADGFALRALPDRGPARVEGGHVARRRHRAALGERRHDARGRGRTIHRRGGQECLGADEDQCQGGHPGEQPRLLGHAHVTHFLASHPSAGPGLAARRGSRGLPAWQACGAFDRPAARLRVHAASQAQVSSRQAGLARARERLSRLSPTPERRKIFDKQL